MKILALSYRLQLDGTVEHLLRVAKFGKVPPRKVHTHQIRRVEEEVLQTQFSGEVSCLFSQQKVIVKRLQIRLCHLSHHDVVLEASV